MFVFGGRSGMNTVGEGFNETQIFTPGAFISPSSL
jgi:hypothetical protein